MRLKTQYDCCQEIFCHSPASILLYKEFLKVKSAGVFELTVGSVLFNIQVTGDPLPYSERDLPINH